MSLVGKRCDWRWWNNIPGAVAEHMSPLWESFHLNGRSWIIAKGAGTVNLLGHLSAENILYNLIIESGVEGSETPNRSPWMEWNKRYPG